ncbi:MAG: hypothetical protein FWD58_02680, partial [Firmicutes bacterium]|nr:hypothetical protein [Bacillota bacterium]
VGEERRYCTYEGCTDYETREIEINPDAHAWGEWSVTAPATCSAKGVETRTCVHNSAHTETREIEIDPDAHSFGEWVVTTAPTVSTEGLLTRACSHDSSHTETFTLPILSTDNGYAYGIEAAATCETAGMGRYSYEKDEQTFTFDVTIPALGHNWGDWVVTTAPTVSTEGLLTRACSHDSSHTETFTLPVLGTDNGYAYGVAAAATCETAGTGRYSYEKDEQTFTFDVTIPALGHNWGDWIVTTPPTETEDGVETRICSRCGETETKPIPFMTYSVTAEFGAWDGNGNASSTINADHTKFVKLLLDGKTVDPSHYTVTEGSTVITLKESYLKTLDNGTHIFVAEFSDGVSETITLTVNNKGGLNVGILIAIIAGSAAFITVAFTIIIAVKKKKKA